MCELVTQCCVENRIVHSTADNLVQLFEEQVKKTPDNRAIIYNGIEVTYDELNKQANRLANQLIILGTKKETIIGILLEKNAYTIISIIAVLKTGGAYLPIDSNNPLERINFMLKDSEASILITQKSLFETANNCLVKINKHLNLVLVDESVSNLPTHEKNLNLSISENNLAYVIYTSGSTGKPKGVMIEHRQVISLLSSTKTFYKFTEKDSWPLFHSIAFDVSVWEIWGALGNGGCLVIVPHHITKDTNAFYKLVEEQNITVLNQTPSAFDNFVLADNEHQLSNLKLRYIILAGEAINIQKMKPWWKKYGDKTPQIINMYGTTETTVHATFHPLTLKDLDKNNNSPIGLPLPHLFFLILDNNMKTIPIGHYGEIYIGGTGVARGYLNRSQLTQERFLINTLIDGTNYPLLYKTGDLAKKSSNGKLEFLGRIDDQIKIRGFRIELGEIEKRILEHPNIKQTIVIPKSIASSGLSLVAYIIPQKNHAFLDEQALQDFLRRTLPEYMIPNRIITLKQLPLNQNGKIDKNALPTPKLNENRLIISPSNLVEENIRNIFAKILQQDPCLISVNDNFFAIGGDSLLAINVILEFRKIFNLEFPAHLLFEHPTIASLAAHINKGVLKQLQKLPPVKIIASQNRYKPQELSFAQQRLWFLQQLQPNSSYYNVFLALELSGQLNYLALEKAFAELISRHESLRTQFIFNQNQPWQIVLPKDSIIFKLACEDFSSQPEQVLIDTAHQEAQKPFNLEKAPLLRVRLLHCHTKKHLLFINFHHIIIDGTSIHILFAELSTLYANYCLKRTTKLTSKNFDYLDFAIWQRAWLSSSTLLTTQKQYWLEQLQNLPPVELITDFRRPVNLNYRGSHYPFKINLQLTKRLQDFTKNIPTTLFTTLLTGFFILLSRYTQQNDLAIGTPNASRHYPGFKSTIGFFINLLILRCKITPTTDVLSLLKENHQTLAQAFANQDIPFEQVVEALHPSRAATTNPLCSILFVFQNYAHAPLNLTGLKTKRVFSDNDSLLFGDYESSKFDLTLYLQETADGLEGLIEFNTSIFALNTIKRISNHLQNVLLSMLENPRQLIHTLPLLDEMEKKQILQNWNLTKINYPRQKTISHLIFEQAQQNPNRSAVIFKGQILTYQELQRKVDKLACYLLEQKVQPNTLVIVYLDRDIDLPSILLAILKIGAAYIPIDINWPQERVKQIVTESRANTLLINCEHGSWLEEIATESLQILHIKNIENSDYRQEIDDLSNPKQLAYVMYTSGTTGKPKGVAIENSSVVNFLFAMQKELQLTPADNMLALTTYTFDISGLEIYLPLITGATCVIVDKETASDGDLLSLAIAQYAITVMQATPATWHLLLESGWQGKIGMKLLTGGEALAHPLGKKLLKAVGSFWNVYGPTEATIWSTIEKVQHIDEQTSASSLAIGKPLGNARAYVLDQYNQISPIGCVGQLYLAGDGLARGYLHQPELTNKFFISAPIPEIQESKLYKTGDRVRWLADGRLEYLSRNDNQVKIRGFRVELSEVEHWLLKHPCVSRAVVVAKEDSAATNSLLAYVVLTTENAKNNTYQSLQNEQIAHWKTVYDESYHNASAQVSGLITAGWNSSYTLQPIPNNEMQEWVNGAVERILSLNPKRILEIGCGTGMLLLRLLPLCEFYCATDIASQALTHIKTQIKKLAINGSFTLSERPAHVLSKEETKAYDTVILNSVIQYFPNMDYLLTVLENAIAATSMGGHVFIGDIRSLTHLENFCAAVQLARATTQTTVNEWRTAIKKQMQEEEELVIAPQFFRAFADYHPRVSGITMQLKRGRFINEMTQFRYDIILHIEQKTCAITPKKWINWQEQPWQVAQMQTYLRQNKPNYLAFCEIPNFRLNLDARQIAMDSADKPRSVGNLREVGSLQIKDLLEYSTNYAGEKPLLEQIEAIKTSSQNSCEFIDLDALWDIEKSVPYNVEIYWSETNPLRTVDVIFRQQTQGYQKVQAKINKSPQKFTNNSSELINNPIKEKLQKKIVSDLRAFLQEKVPNYMIPSAFITLDSIPTNANGKIDRNLLPQFNKSCSDKLRVIPQDKIEMQMLELWSHVLQLETLSTDDNFFEKGGHSLLAVQLIAQAKSIFQINLGLATLFEYPTIKKLSDFIKQEKSFYQENSSIKIKSSDNRKANTIITLEARGENYPLFLLHPIGGNVLCYAQLHQKLQVNRPIYAIQDPSITRNSLCFSSIKEMAHAYRTEIKKVQPHGPYYLGGYSMGGLIATEVAIQLMSEKETVKWLGLIDTAAPLLMDNFTLTAKIDANAKEQYKIFKESFENLPYDSPFFEKIYQHHAKLISHYQPSVINCPTYLFKTKATKSEVNNYWERYAQANLAVYNIPGDHNSIMKKPYVMELASAIAQSLTAIESFV